MKTLFFFLMLASLVASGQTITYLKVADREDYNNNYLPYCQAPVERTFAMCGEVTLIKVNGYYTQPITGDWVAKFPLVVKWYPIEAKSTVTEAYQQEIVAYFTAMVPRRYPWSIDDYYKNWKTGNIQAGHMDSKVCGACIYPIK